MNLRVLIVGAGVAGSAAAVLLARGGADVTLVEQKRFPRDKVCGECVSALGLGVLERLGVDLAGGVRLTRTRVVAANGATLDAALPRAMLGLRRATLDVRLRDLAASAGARVLQPARVEAHGEGRARVRDLTTNAVDDHAADLILLADGGRGGASGDFGLAAHFADVDGDGDARAIELFGGRGAYVGLAPVDGELWNVAAGVPAAWVAAARGDLNAVCDRLAGQNRAFAERLARATRVTPWHSCPLPRRSVARAWPPGVVPLGNAAAAIEPIGGEGMGLALRTAELAAEAILAGDDLARLPARFDALYRGRARWCRLAAQTVIRPRLARVALSATRWGGVAPLALRLVGKTA